MKKFMDDNFLLNNEVAVKLYHDIAKDMPIFDYHCHLSPKEIWEDKSYRGCELYPETKDKPSSEEDSIILKVAYKSFRSHSIFSQSL